MSRFRQSCRECCTPYGFGHSSDCFLGRPSPAPSLDNTLDREMARINKMHISAGERADMVKRAKSIWTCAFSPSRDEGSEWCALCGYHCDSHLKNVVTE